MLLSWIFLLVAASFAFDCLEIECPSFDSVTFFLYPKNSRTRRSFRSASIWITNSQLKEGVSHLSRRSGRRRRRRRLCLLATPTRFLLTAKMVRTPLSLPLVISTLPWLQVRMRVCMWERVGCLSNQTPLSLPFLYPSLFLMWWVISARLREREHDRLELSNACR